MATRVISTSLKMDGEAEFKRQMADVNREMRTLRSEMAYSEEQFKGQANTMEALTEKDKLLRREIEQQTEKINALERALSDATEVYGESDKRTDGYRQSLLKAKTELIKMNRELEDNSKYLDEARRSADHTADSIDEFGREAKDAGDAFGGMGGGLGDLAGQLGNLKGMLAGGAVVGGLKAVADAVISIEESTREHRKIMGTLETSSAAAGYSAQQTAQAYEHLYGVLGDDQTAATTVANLQAINLNQEVLMQLIDACTGAWATYGDSIPIDGLAESINETIQAGQVTGVFADVLNWAGTSEDAFNELLATTSDTSMRANIVMKELAQQGLAETGQAWRENNEDIIAMNESEGKMQEAWSELGETLSPIASFFKETMAGAIGEVTEAVQGAYEFVDDLIIVFGDLNDKINAWIDSWDFSGVYDWVDKINDKMADTEWGNGGTVQQGLAQMSATMDAIPHANGLAWVPYDGYLAELHKGEAVLTAQENRIWQQFRGASEPAAVTAPQLQQMLVGTVNALGTAQMGQREYIGTTVLQIDGLEFARATQPYFRAEDSANPEVVSDG